MFSRVLFAIAIQGVLVVPALLARTRWMRALWVSALLALDLGLASFAVGPETRAVTGEIQHAQDAHGRIGDLAALQHDLVDLARRRRVFEVIPLLSLAVLALVPIGRRSGPATVDRKDAPTGDAKAPVAPSNRAL
jgi:hypothetical protein